VLVILGLVTLPYVASPVYRFPAPRPFRGSALYDPYAAGTGTWLLANFHSHGRAWGGLTDGDQTDRVVLAHYRALGYDLPGVSDYHTIDRARTGDSTFLPAYEHGYSVRKAHFLVLDARRVDWFDFPLLQSVDDKQYLIDRLKRTATLVAINHPSLRNAESADDLRYLTHYDLLEVLNHFTTSDREWDAALSSGHAVWALGDDDSHNVDDAGQTGVMWTLVDAPSTRRDAVLDALRAGRTIAVAGHGAVTDVPVRAIALHGDTLRVTCAALARSITFIGQGGRVLARATGVAEAAYVVQPTDPYVRTVIVTPRTTMYLNPVVRYDGVALQQPIAVFDAEATWVLRLERLALLLAAVCVLVAVMWRPRPRPMAIAPPAPRPIAQAAD
jgi:hypothetical protein